MADEQVFDGIARLFGKGGRALEVEARQQQGEFLAAVTGDEHSLLQGDQRQCLADRAQAGVAPDMAVTVVEQLEMIDIDHHQRERLAALGRSTPLALELAVEAAPVGQAGKAVEARQLLQVLIGDLQFLFARRKLARHVVERGGKRFEFGNPGLLRWRPRADRRGRNARPCAPVSGSGAG